MSDNLYAALKTLFSQLGVQRIAPEILAELVGRGWAEPSSITNPYLTRAGHSALNVERRRRGEGGF